MENSPSSNIFRSNLIIASCAVILGVVFNYLFFEHVPGVSFLLFIGLALVLFYAAHYYFRNSHARYIYLVALIVFFSLMVAVRASMLLTFLNIVLVFYLLLLLSREATGHRFRSYSIKDYILAGLLPLLNFIVYALRTIGDLFSLKGAIHKRETTSDVLRGIVMAIPVIFIFLLLFASADLAFHKFLTSIVNLDFPEEFWAQMFLMGFIMFGSLGAFAYVFMNRKSEDIAPAAEKPITRLSAVQISVFLGIIDALFLLFIAFQLRYLFGGHANITGQGFTYAEYAHRGFAELIAVALISLVLILSAERYVNRRETSHMTSFKVTSLILIAAVVILMISAFKRLSIYQDAYGFTVLRFYVSAFIIWLAALFVIFGYKISKHKADKFFSYSIFLAVIIFVALMNIVNPEGIIARQNISRYVAGDKFDGSYLSQLSTDTVPAMVAALDSTNQQVREELASRLYNKYRDLQEDQSVWQETTWSKWRAKVLLESKIDILEQYDFNYPGYILDDEEN